MGSWLCLMVLVTVGAWAPGAVESLTHRYATMLEMIGTRVWTTTVEDW